MSSSRTLYNLSGCPYCIRVKRRLAELGLPYDEIQVPRLRALRRTVKELSGQRRVPVLVDNGAVIHDSRAILAHLDRTYGPPAACRSDAAAAAGS